METENLVFAVIRVILGFALIASLLGAGLSVYRRLPSDGPGSVAGDASDGAQTELTVILRSTPEFRGAAPEAAIELYPVDVAALQREFLGTPHPGKRFDDFLAQRLRGKPPVQMLLDKNGQAIVKLAPGNWWLHAKLTIGDDESAEWRLPVSVAGDKQTVELTRENAYERTKKF